MTKKQLLEFNDSLIDENLKLIAENKALKAQLKWRNELIDILTGTQKKVIVKKEIPSYLKVV
jgi:hypothetical protein